MRYLGHCFGFVSLLKKPVRGNMKLVTGSSFPDVVGEKLRVKELNSSALKDFIDKVYENTSKHLLDVLYRKYKFHDHLKVRASPRKILVRC